MSEGVEWAVHCCTVLAFAPEDGPGIPAAKLAEFHAVPPAYLTKVMQALVRDGICASIPGPKGGFKLARPADAISLLDITLAVDGDETAFRCSEIRQRGPAAVDERHYRRPCGIARAFWAAEEAWRASLAAVTVADIGQELATTVHPHQLQRGAEWLATVLIR